MNTVARHFLEKIITLFSLFQEFNACGTGQWTTSTAPLFPCCSWTLDKAEYQKETFVTRDLVLVLGGQYRGWEVGANSSLPNQRRPNYPDGYHQVQDGDSESKVS